MIPFEPAPWSIGPHRQTLCGYWYRYLLAWPHPIDDIVVGVDVEAEKDVRLLVRASWQEHRERKPTLVIVHGLGGCSEGSYGIALGRLAFARGWNVARMNMRSAGLGFPHCQRLYNAGLDGDLVAVLNALARITPRLAVAGFSLGGNLTALALGRSRARLPAGLFAGAAVSPPLDLSACADALDSPRNRLYCKNYVVQLGRSYRYRQRLRPDLFEAGRERGLRTIREFDDKITAPHGGYSGAAEYYERSSAGPHMTAVAVPTLLLAAADDPMIPIDSVTRWPRNDRVTLEVTTTGGHVGFFARAEAPGRFWAADRVMDYLTAASG